MKNVVFSGILIITIFTISISLISEQVMAQTMMTPKQQMMMGTNSDQITCADGKVLMMNNMGMPACVTPSTYWRLADRGWGNFDTELLAKNQNHMHGVMGAMINHPEMSKHMHDWMQNNPEHMQTMMNNWMPQMMQNQQWMNNMMGPIMNHMMNDPQMQQQMMNHMINHPQMMQQWMQNQQFTNSRNDGVDDKKTETNETSVNSKNTPVSIALGSASPGCETTNECYLLYSVLIKEHSSVTWTNDDMAVHTATSGMPSEGPNGIFDSGLISPGDTYTNQFDEEGTFDYYCIAHPWMTGKVIVN